MAISFTHDTGVDFDLVYIRVDARPHCWGDAVVNGVCDKDGSLIPLREGDSWRPMIELETGRILDWPAGVVAEIEYKASPQSEYTLIDSGGLGRLTKMGYVPAMLSPKVEEHEDRIIMDIAADGTIRNWGIDLFDFADARIIPQSEGWKERSRSILRALIHSLGDQREKGAGLDIQLIRNTVTLNGFYEMYKKAEAGKLTEKDRMYMKAYIEALPGWKSGGQDEMDPMARVRAAARAQGRENDILVLSDLMNGESPDEARDRMAKTTPASHAAALEKSGREQHGYLEMQLTNVLSALADSYGHFIKKEMPELDSRNSDLLPQPPYPGKPIIRDARGRIIPEGDLDAFLNGGSGEGDTKPGAAGDDDEPPFLASLRQNFRTVTISAEFPGERRREFTLTVGRQFAGVRENPEFFYRYLFSTMHAPRMPDGSRVPVILLPKLSDEVGIDEVGPKADCAP